MSDMDLEKLKAAPFKLPLRKAKDGFGAFDILTPYDVDNFVAAWLLKEHADYIVAAVNAAPALVEEIERLRERIKELEKGQIALVEAFSEFLDQARAALRASEPKESK